MKVNSRYAGAMSDVVRAALKRRKASLAKIAAGTGVTEVWLRKILKGANASKAAEKRILDFLSKCPTCGRKWPEHAD